MTAITTLTPKPGFEWAKVKWVAGNKPRSDKCSYCAVEIDEDSVPLMMWTADGTCAQFCDACQVTWWGVHPMSFADDPPYEDP